MYTYDPVGNLATHTDFNGLKTTYAYDKLNRLLTKGTPEGTLTYTYDAHGNVLTINSSNTNGASLTYTYDVLNRLLTAKDNRMAALGGPSTPTTYSYDAVGNLSNYTYPNTVQTANVVASVMTVASGCMT